MQPSERAEFREIVISSCRHVLPQCGLPIEPDPADVTAIGLVTEQMAGFIGFTADTLRGALTFLAPLDLVRVSYPLVLKKGMEGNLELFDWCGEVVNRLLGRIKGGLGARGVDIDASTPKAMMGEQLQIAVLERRAICALEFPCGGGKVAVLVDAVSPAGVTLFKEPVDASSLPQEGELLLF
jgi:CheY-specific phosphatase CheX